MDQIRFEMAQVQQLASILQILLVAMVLLKNMACTVTNGIIKSLLPLLSGPLISAMATHIAEPLPLAWLKPNRGRAHTSESVRKACAKSKFHDKQHEWQHNPINYYNFLPMFTFHPCGSGLRIEGQGLRFTANWEFPEVGGPFCGPQTRNPIRNYAVLGSVVKGLYWEPQIGNPKNIAGI